MYLRIKNKMCIVHHITYSLGMESVALWAICRQTIASLASVFKYIYSESFRVTQP